MEQDGAAPEPEQPVKPEASLGPPGCNVDTGELERLCGLIEDHAARRGDAEVPRALAEACCLTLIAGPLELGTEPEPSPLRDRAAAALGAPGPADPPEVRVCRAWLACIEGRAPADAADQFATLAAGPVWEPIRSLAFRALAHAGRRGTLAGLLEQAGPPSLFLADARLDAATGDATDAAPEAPAAPDGLLPPDVCSEWADLLSAERALASGGADPTVEQTLARLAETGAAAPPRTLGESVRRRTAARAVAALVRARLGRGRGDEGLLGSPAARWLPAWEREYLRALVHWVIEDLDTTAQRLERAQELNPHQTPVRLARAALLAGGDPATALEALEVARPSRDVLISRAALLARMSRYDEAGAALEADARWEPARFTWPRARIQFRWRAGLLRIALAARRGDWKAAEEGVRSLPAGTRGRSKSLHQARQLFLAALELRTGAPADDWRRGQLERQVKRARYEIGDIPLLGSAGFFRGAAETEARPDRAAKDLRALLRRRQWVEGERRVGGGRLVFVGDALARLGHLEDALRAYDLAAGAGSAEAAARRAVLRVCTAEPNELADAVTGAIQSAPGSPWPHVLAAVRRLMTGAAGEVAAHLEAAEQKGAPAALGRCLRALAGSGERLSDADLAGLELSPQTGAVMRLLVGEGAEADKLTAFAATFGEGWMARFPGDAGTAAARLVSALCEAGEWDDALSLARELGRSGSPEAVELHVLVRLRHALSRAAQEPEKVERELRALGPAGPPRRRDTNGTRANR